MGSEKSIRDSGEVGGAGFGSESLGEVVCEGCEEQCGDCNEALAEGFLHFGCGIHRVEDYLGIHGLFRRAQRHDGERFLSWKNLTFLDANYHV